MVKFNYSNKELVAFIDQNLDGGGAERVMCTIIRSLEPSKFDIHLILIGKLGTLSYLLPNYVTVHELGVANTRGSLLPFIKIIRKLRPITIFSTLSRTTVLSVLARPFCCHFKLIARYPSMPSLEKHYGGNTGWRYWLMKLTYKKVDKIISQTEEMAVELEQFYGIKRTKIVTIYNPIDFSLIDSFIKNSANPFEEKYFNIVASGRLTHEKGFDVLIKGFSLAAKHDDSLRLHILGQDMNDYKKILTDVISSYNVQSKVKFYGFVKNPYIYYHYADLFVLSSRREGFPNVLLENLYLGKKVIATNCIPIITRLIRSKGILVDVDSSEQIGHGILESKEFRFSEVRVQNTVMQFQKLFSL